MLRGRPITPLAPYAHLFCLVLLGKKRWRRQQRGKRTCPHTTPNVPKSNRIPVCSLSKNENQLNQETFKNRSSKGTQTLNDAAKFLALTSLPHGLYQRYDAFAASVDRAYIGRGDIKSCRGLRRNQSWNSPTMDEKAQGNMRQQPGPLHKMKSPDSLFLILPKTYYGVSEFSGDHFIYFLRFLLTKLLYICFVL